MNDVWAILPLAWVYYLDFEGYLADLGDEPEAFMDAPGL